MGQLRHKITFAGGVDYGTARDTLQPAHGRTPKARAWNRDGII